MLKPLLAAALLAAGCRPTAPESPLASPKSDAAPLIDRDVFFDESARGIGSLSHDGSRLVFTAPDDHGGRGLFVGAFDDGVDGGRFVMDAAAVASSTFSSDDRFLLIRADTDGNEDYHLLALDLERPDAPLVDLVPNLPEGASASFCSLLRETPDEVVVTVNDRDLKVPDVYRLDLTTGAREALFRSPPDTISVFCDASGRPRALTRAADMNRELARIDGGDTVVLQRYAHAETMVVVSIDADGLATLATNRGHERDRVELVTLDLMRNVETLVHRDPQQRVDLRQVTLDGTDRVAAVGYVDDRIRFYALDPRFEALLAATRDELGDDDMVVVAHDDALARWIVRFDGPTRPPTYFAVEPGRGVTKRLFTSRPKLASETLAPARPIRYTARDGLEISGYLTLPHAVPQSNLPLVVMVHGGPWSRDVWGYDPEAQFLANRGYAVLQPNFRGSEGFGKAFKRAANGTWGLGAAQHDITDGVDALIKRGIVDADRVCIYGGSYGGYAALAGLAFTPKKYACGISYVGPSNLVTLTESFPEAWRTSLGIWFEAFGDPTVPDERADLERRSPLFAAEAIAAPLMVVHGANDPRVKQAESDQIVQALRDRGRPVRYLVADDEGHGFARPLNRRAMYAALEHFLATHLGGRRQTDLKPAVRRRLEQMER